MKKLNIFILLNLLFMSGYGVLASDLVQRGDMFILKKDYKQAAKVFSKAAEQDPQNSEAFRGLGDALYYSKNTLKVVQKAFKNYQKAHALDPNNSNALYGIAQCYLSFGNYPKAIDFARSALGINPGYAEAQFAIAAAVNLSGDYEGSIEEFKKVLILNPDDDLAVRNIGIEYARMLAFSKSIKIYQDYLREHPQNVAVAVDLAWVYYLDQQFNEAVRTAQTVLARDPKNEKARAWMEKAKKGKVDQEKILRLIDTILDDFSVNGTGYEKEIAMKLKDGKAGEVLKILKPSIEGDTKDGLSSFLYALASFMVGKHTDARRFCSQSIGLEYQNKYLREFRDTMRDYDSLLTPFIR